jgi:hypothetical protein
VVGGPKAKAEVVGVIGSSNRTSAAKLSVSRVCASVCVRRLADGPNRPHLDAADLSGGNAGGDLDGFVEVAGLDHVEAGEAFLGLGEGAIVAHADGGGGGDGLEGLGGDAVAARADGLVEGEAA